MRNTTQQNLLKKTLLATAISIAASSSSTYAAITTFTGGNFTMLTSLGSRVGGTNDVAFIFDDALTNNTVNGMSFNGGEDIATAGPEPFSGYLWTAHHVRVFDPGTYTFNSSCTVAEIEAGTAPAACAAGTPDLTMTVAAGQYGAHMLFDWNISSNIDVAIVWDQTAAWVDQNPGLKRGDLWLGAAGTAPDPTTLWDLVSTDDDVDAVNGIPMVDGPFTGFNANFNFGPGGTGVSVIDQVLTSQDTQVGGGGCSINRETSTITSHSDWLLVFGFLTGMGFWRKKYKS